MITITDPKELDWQTGMPLPSANLCHPDSRIIIWNNVLDEYIEVAVLSPKDNYWQDNHHKVWAPNQFKMDCMKLAWFRKF